MSESKVTQFKPEIAAVEFVRNTKVATVTMVFPKAMKLLTDDHQMLHFNAGPQEVAAELADHHYFEANGVKRYEYPVARETPVVNNVFEEEEPEEDEELEEENEELEEENEERTEENEEEPEEREEGNPQKENLYKFSKQQLFARAAKLNLLPNPSSTKASLVEEISAEEDRLQNAGINSTQR